MVDEYTRECLALEVGRGLAARRVTVAGKHCESGDLIVRDAAVDADLAVGDLLCTPATGAYGRRTVR